jgi:beta-galactosidase
VSRTRDEFLVDLYDSLHATSMQEKFRRIAPMPVGVVFIQWPDMTEDDVRRHFRLMKKLGFTCLKGLNVQPGTDRKRVMHMALDEGIIPWWYGEGGWEPITDELLADLGIDPDTPIEQIRANEKFLAHQDKVMRRRIDAMAPRRGRHSGRPGAAGFSFDAELKDESPEARAAKQAMLIDAAKQEVLNLLSPEQRRRWQSLLGSPP